MRSVESSSFTSCMQLQQQKLTIRNEFYNSLQTHIWLINSHWIIWCNDISVKEKRNLFAGVMGSTFDCFVWSKIEIIFSWLIAALVSLLPDHLFVLQPCLLLVSQRSSQRVPLVSSTSTESVIRNFTSMPKIQGIITVFPFFIVLLTYFAQNDLSGGGSTSPSAFSPPRTSSVNIGVLLNSQAEVYTYNLTE